jgi:triphosphoribosyl-dephospho-CoA synthase
MTAVTRDMATALLAVDRRHAPVNVGIAAQLACLLEVSAPKPGNVSPGRHFADLRYEDFLASAVAIGEPMAEAGTHTLGATIRRAAEATARWSASNTNLGIILLFAPLARAALLAREPASPSAHITLRDRVKQELSATTVDDAKQAYTAIRLARPGGLDQVEAQDVATEPTVSLTEAMRLAAGRDTIASEYATAFDLTFATAVPVLERARRDGLPWDDAIVETFLTILALVQDTHIKRRSGATLAAEVTGLARTVLAAGGVRSRGGRAALDVMDRSLRDDRNSGNPGTTADVTAAAIFVVLLGGGWE